MYVLTDLQPRLSFDTLDPAHFYEVHRHMHAYYYTLLFTGSFACIVKAVTARAITYVAVQFTVSLTTYGNSTCSSRRFKLMSVHNHVLDVCRLQTR